MIRVLSGQNSHGGKWEKSDTSKNQRMVFSLHRIYTELYVVSEFLLDRYRLLHHKMVFAEPDTDEYRQDENTARKDSVPPSPPHLNVHSFGKTLTTSDTSTHGRFSVLRRHYFSNNTGICNARIRIAFRILADFSTGLCPRYACDQKLKIHLERSRPS
ncbi:hypothetical protein POM88_015873 [Heracleum sosnowskyi]|uniref:Uncharacterized protein n=1 Tax=Heracleum sosnowskyi TaxID=360622 RepID=A0AAD8IL22_9APIA|nr:hypothetical protein POM88_015873 [Heracleum sosnowskyi]